MRRFSSLPAALTVMASVWSASVLAQPPAHHGPPPEAIEACASKSQGTACTVTFREHTLEGTCESHDGGTLACRPAHHGPPPEALAACSGKQEGTACTVTFHDRSMEGQCRTGPDQQLACHPAHGHGGGPGGPGGQGGPPPSSK